MPKNRRKNNTDYRIIDWNISMEYSTGFVISKCSAIEKHVYGLVKQDLFRSEITQKMPNDLAQ